MGGYGSGRWDGTITRTSTEGLPRLDVRDLARAGGLQRGTRATIAWGPLASVTTEVADDDPTVLTLMFRLRTGRGPWRTVQEQLALMWTACTFGGRRVWFACPGCRSRRAVLYAVAGRFRCCACHRLAYASTRTTR
jgi:hypothetical protein